MAAAELWRAYDLELIENGSLVVAGARDQSELKRFARMTEGHETIAAQRIAELEPDLGDRFATALYYPDEAHMVTPNVMGRIQAAAEAAGATFRFGVEWREEAASEGADV